MQILRQARQRHPRWQPDATYRRLLREQVWWQRRQRLRWEVRRLVTERPRPDFRSLVTERPRPDFRRLRPERPRLDVRRLRPERPRLDLRRRWSERPRLSARAGRAVRRVAVVTLVVLLGGVAGHGGATTGQPSAMGADRSAAAPSEGEQRPKPGVTGPGIFLSVAVDDFGQLTAVEQARTDTPLTELSLVPPPPPAGSRRLPQLQNVQLFADGEPVSVPTTIEVTTLVALTGPATRIELRYKVVGAAARSKPAERGRATLSLRPALVPTSMTRAPSSRSRAPRSTTWRASTWLGRSSSAVSTAEHGWRTRRLPSASSAVVALVNLPDRAA